MIDFFLFEWERKVYKTFFLLLVNKSNRIPFLNKSFSYILAGKNSISEILTTQVQTKAPLYIAPSSKFNIDTEHIDYTNTTS